MVYKLVSTTKSQVGKYVDVNGDGIPEGIIFADLAVGGKGEYGDGGAEHNGIYSIPTKNNLKDYIVVGEYENQINGKQEVLSPILDGIDRFYIMALNDFEDERNDEYFAAYCWYLYGKPNNSVTSEKFGSGRQNTLNMIRKYNGKEFGPRSEEDFWVYPRRCEKWLVCSID